VAHHTMKLESAQKSALRSVTALLGPAADDPVATRSCMAFWLEPIPFRLNRNGALFPLFDAFSSREPVTTSLENALGSKLNQTIEVRLQIRFKLCKELGDGK